MSKIWQEKVAKTWIKNICHGFGMPIGNQPIRLVVCEK
jgi:hypothetical protein